MFRTQIHICQLDLLTKKIPPETAAVDYVLGLLTMIDSK